MWTEGRQDQVAGFTPREKGRLQVIGGTDGLTGEWSGGLIGLIGWEFPGGYQGNQQKGTPLMAPLIRTITVWDLGQVCRMVSPVHRGKVKLALVGPGMATLLGQTLTLKPAPWFKPDSTTCWLCRLRQVA